MATTIASLRADVIMNTAKAEGATKRFEGDLRKLRSTLNRLETAEEKQERQLEDLRKAQQAGVISTKQFTEAQRRLDQQVNRSNRGLKQQGQGLRAFGGAIASRIPGMGMMGLGPGAMAGAALAGGAFGVARGVSSTAGRLTEVGDMASRLGMSTAGLRAIQETAMLTGSSAQTAAMAMQRMTRRIAQAAQGTGEAQQTLQALGLNARELAAMRPEDQFAAIADVWDRIEGSGDEVLAAFKLFDSEGVSLVNALRETSVPALKEMTEQFKEAYSEDNVAQARKLQEQQLKLNKQWETMSTTLFTKLLPAGTAVLEILNAVTGGGPVGPIGTAVVNYASIGGYADPSRWGQTYMTRIATDPRYRQGLAPEVMNPAPLGAGSARANPEAARLNQSIVELTRMIDRMIASGADWVSIEQARNRLEDLRDQQGSLIGRGG